MWHKTYKHVNIKKNHVSIFLLVFRWPYKKHIVRSLNCSAQNKMLTFVIDLQKINVFSTPFQCRRSLVICHDEQSIKKEKVAASINIG